MVDRAIYPTIVAFAIALHATWAVTLIVDPAAINATAIHALLTISGNSLAASIILIVVAGLAAIGLIDQHRHIRVWLILPQHIVLVVSAVGVTNAMYLGQFADGVPRSHGFIIVDQIPIVLASIGHTIALLRIAGEK